MNLYVTQVKRELWENKVSFINTPIIITALILLLAIFAALYSNGVIDPRGVHFNFTSNGIPGEAGVTVSDQSTRIDTPIITDGMKEPKNFRITSSVASDPKAFNGIVMGVMYANCMMLYLVFSIVLGAYALRCLLDDRKNKDILFWRSMPVSETTNVLVKLGMLLFAGPIIMLILNYIVTLISFFIGLILFVSQGVSFSYLMSSVFNGGAFYIPFQVFYELVFSLLMLMPVIGFALFASAFAKKTPFFTFASPVVLILADKILNSVFRINLGIIDALALYGRALVSVKEAFVLHESFVFYPYMILPLIICLGIGALFVAGAIWLRNHRYEI